MSTSTITPAMARRIEIWPVERLVRYAKNARTHSPEQVAQIAASIVQFGFNNPVLVDTAHGIIAGHGRLMAARKLDLKEIPVVVLDHLNETQRRAYIIADNKLALNAGWDEAILAEELRDLVDDGLDLSVVGSSEDELPPVLADPHVAGRRDWLRRLLQRGCSRRTMSRTTIPPKTRRRSRDLRRLPRSAGAVRALFDGAHGYHVAALRIAA